MGSYVISNGMLGVEIDDRIQAGWNNWRKVSRLVCVKKISGKVKKNVYQIVVRRAMISIYGTETCSIKKTEERKKEEA
jgi:hypothetical protein